MASFNQSRNSPAPLPDGLPARISPWSRSPPPQQRPKFPSHQQSTLPDEDDLPTDSDIRHDIWQLYNEQASKWREDFNEKWNKEMESMLLFATLFSAVVTAFVVLSYPTLRPDTGSATVALLSQLVDSINQNQTQHLIQASTRVVSQSSFIPMAYAVRVNAFWFASLVVSVSVAFLTILAKQWLASLGGDQHPSVEICGRQYQYRYDNARAWRLASALEFLPLLLHMSLLLFFAGLIDFLWATNTAVAVVATVLIGFTVAIYIGSYVLSHLSSTCPYRTSVDPTTWTWEFLRRSIYTSWKITYPLVKFYRTVLRMISWCGIEIPPSLAYPARGPILRTEYVMRAYAAPLVDSQSREFNYVFGNPELMDARVLSRMVASFQAGLANHDLERLAHAIARFPHLVAHRDQFIDAGTVRFLTQWLGWLEQFDFANLAPLVQRDFALVSRALARLLTEVEENDSRMSASPLGLPQRYKRPQETMSLNADLALRTLKLPSIDEINEEVAEENPGDIVLFSHRLRLQLVAFPLTWYAGCLKDSVKEYYGRLLAYKRLNSLGSEDRMSLINTTIYVATRVIDPEKWTKPAYVVEARLEHKHSALDALAALVLHNTGMDFALLRQVCWALSVLSIPERRLIPKFDDFHLLITQVRRTDHLLRALTHNVLDPVRQHPVMLHAMLAVFEEMLYSTYNGGSTVDDPDERNDRIQLLTALIARYTSFLVDLKAVLVMIWNCPEGQPANSWQPAEFTLRDSRRLLQRIVRVSGFLGYYCPTDLGALKIDREQITHSTLELLQFMCNHEHVDSAPEDRIAVHRIAYGAACRFTILNCGVPTPIVPPADEFVFDEYSAKAVSEQMLAALQVASAVFEPPESVKTVLSMIADLRYITSESRFRSGILAYLRKSESESESGVLGLLEMLLEKRCKAGARDAIDTVQGLGGLQRPLARVVPRQVSRGKRPRPRLDTTKAGIRLK
ncbi:hypothetical protein DAEQUDRAFT_769022 [Daedalea quercina L-15889]|uniref:DUF6535 domain-containing protein n=1 Tax=Daedalea quercina L-15889 TaxID=1314783 RepID=A0A165M5Y3_9APHY|nr:hypothetical protein DAEQUDRAFT_769022 [Daedalea quercina L-15889]